VDKTGQKTGYFTPVYPSKKLSSPIGKIQGSIPAGDTLKIKYEISEYGRKPAT
jgi:hypothetical protein